MKRDKYTLLYNNIPIGIVETLDADFPNLWGAFTLFRMDEHPDVRNRIRAFLDYSHEANRLMDLDHVNPVVPSRYESFVSERESAFLDLIESRRWTLVDKAEKRRP